MKFGAFLRVCNALCFPLQNYFHIFAMLSYSSPGRSMLVLIFAHDEDLSLKTCQYRGLEYQSAKAM